MGFYNLTAQDTTHTQNNKMKHSSHFVDKNGDGYNDNAPDHDGDGIPNGLDPDWIKLKNKNKFHRPFRDLDGDGINDFAPMGRKGMMPPPKAKNPKGNLKGPGSKNKPPMKRMKGKH